MIPTQNNMAEKLAHLLAESPLDEEIKEAILEKLDVLPEAVIIRLIDSLEKEREELKRIEFEDELFKQIREENWQDLEEKQRAFTDDFTNKVAEKIEAELEKNE